MAGQKWDLLYSLVRIHIMAEPLSFGARIAGRMRDSICIFLPLGEEKLRSGSVKPSPAALVRAALKLFESRIRWQKIKATLLGWPLFFGRG